MKREQDEAYQASLRQDRAKVSVAWFSVRFRSYAFDYLCSGPGAR